MTDNDLRTLLRDAADEVDVPRLPTDEIHLRIRSIHRRRRSGLVAAAAALVLACGIGTYALSETLGDDGPNIAAAEGDPKGWAVAEGGAVHFGDGTVVRYGARVNDLRYTSVGMLTRSTRANARLSLITTAGVQRLDLGDMSERLIGADPDSPYIAWTVEQGDGWLVRVMDLGTGERVADVPISGKYTWAGWKNPPVAIDGEHAYVALDDRTLDVDWRTGRVSRSKGLPGGYTTEVINGRAVTGAGRGTWKVVEVASGKVLLTVNGSGDPELHSLRLAPDGRHVLGTPMNPADAAPMYDVDRGTMATIQLGDEFGWTPEGQFIQATGTTVKTCDEMGQECAAAPIDLEKGVSIVSGTMDQD